MGDLIHDGQPFTRRTVGLTGLVRRALPDLVHGGVLHQPLRGVYVDAAAEDCAELRAACVTQILPAGAAVSRRSAAWLWGIDARVPGEHRVPPPLECTVSPPREPISRPGLRCYVATLGASDIGERDGVPVTTPLRTAADLLRFLPPHLALAAADAFAHRHLVDVPQLATEVARWRGGRGVVQARHLVCLVEPLAESAGESWLRLRLADAGFPRPRVQVPIVDDAGHVVYRLDLGWEQPRIAVEYDGEQFHTSPLDRARDELRRATLASRYGWDVVPVGKGEVLGTSMALERGVGELLGLEPRIRSRRW